MFNQYHQNQQEREDLSQNSELSRINSSKSKSNFTINHNKDNKNSSSEWTQAKKSQCIFFIPLVIIKIITPFIFFEYHLVYNNINFVDINYNKNSAIVLLFLIFVCYFLSIKVSPSQLYIDNFYNNEDEKENYNKSSLEIMNIYQQNNYYNKMCDICSSRKHLRAYHCKICNKCILFKEEHCPFIINCIGFGNMQYFINFLFWSIYGLIFYEIYCIKYFISLEIKMTMSTFLIFMSDFTFNIMILKILIQKLFKLLTNIYSNITQYENNNEDDVNENNMLNEKKFYNIFNKNFILNFYYLIGPTPFHLILPLPKLNTYSCNENCSVLQKCKLPNRLESVQFLSKKYFEYKEILDGIECAPDYYSKLCHEYYDNKKIV